MKYFSAILLASFLNFTILKAEEQKPKIDELTAAYQREILFLSTYKKELKNKIESVHSSLGSKVKLAEVELKQLENEWLKQQTQNDLMVQKVNEIEQDYEQRKENNELLEVTIKQAESSQMQKEKKNIGNMTMLDQVQNLFNQATVQVNDNNRITSQEGVFYSQKGEEQKGNIISVGSIGRFAVKDNKTAILYPSGNNTFKVWQWLGDDAHLLSEGKMPKELKFFMFENAEKEFVAQHEKTIFDILRAGGLIGWIIIIMGLTALAISGVRFWLLSKSKNKNDKLLTLVIDKINSNQIEAAQHLLISESSAVTRVLSKTLSYLNREPEKVEDAIMEAIIKESQLIDRFGTVILVIASVAPLMGLLGTVTGMMSTFDIITLYGTGNPKLLSGGISEALVTTMLGLIVAIPALLIGQYLGAKNEYIKSDMEKWALAICNAYKNRGFQE
jgi:biopolymer transport protein ExbB